MWKRKKKDFEPKVMKNFKVTMCFRPKRTTTLTNSQGGWQHATRRRMALVHPDWVPALRVGSEH